MFWYTAVLSFVAMSILLVLPDTIQVAPSDVTQAGLPSIEASQNDPMNAEVVNTVPIEPAISYTYIIQEAQRAHTEAQMASTENDVYSELASTLMATPELVLQMSLIGRLGLGVAQSSGAMDSVSHQIQFLRAFSEPVDSPLQIAQTQ